MNPFRLVVVFLLIIISFVCCSHRVLLKDGDLLFINQKESSLSKAINNVTQTENHTQFDHVAIVRVDDYGVWVLEASSQYGTRKVSIQDFLKEQSTDVHHYRLKKGYIQNADKMWTLAEGMLGKPYNFSYVMNDSSLYCSDFVYRIFESDSIFQLKPMTFRDPQTKEFDARWVDFYAKMGMQVPEGLSGCNPNQMAASEKLDYIGKLEY